MKYIKINLTRGRKISLYITVRLLKEIKENLTKPKDIACLWT